MYFTFGQSHRHVIGGEVFDKDCVVKIEGEDAREKMFKLFDSKWSMQYEEKPDMSLFPRGVFNIDLNDIGDEVACDSCNSSSNKSGGILFSSSAYCPECAPEILKSAKKYGEEEQIKDTCREDESFNEFVLRIRGGNNNIIMITYEK